MADAKAAPQSTFNFKNTIAQMVQRNASDLLLKVGRPPTIRLNGDLQGLEMPPLKPEDLKLLAEQIMTPRQVKEFAERKEADFAIGVPGVGRFRTNIYQQRGTLAFAFRAIPYEVKTVRELHLPLVLEEIALRPRGLVLITGITGSGKSTALASMINHINQHRRVNVITIEDPIEFLHRHKRCIVNQRELGPDATSFADALRGALRQDPDVILLGEMRDLETISTALTAAETGHLVFATLHTQDAASTVDRVIDVFPAGQQGQIRTQLAGTLEGVIAQTLLPTADGQGRVAAIEVLVPDDAVRNLIRQAKIEQVYSIMQTGGKKGMQTMEQALAELVLRGIITQEVAVGRSSRTEMLMGLLNRAAGADGEATPLRVAQA
ncbi:MAG TPA: type IV pilus twitching motility protein PilT [Gaiellaceae bacterium]|nr:type IV pilus twitching motility protein PilT [Gaiellaceae bacterium]